MKKVAELIQSGDWASAEARLMELKRKSSFTHQHLFTLSYVLSAQGKTEAAIDNLRRCLLAAPTFIPAMLNLSILLLQTGDQQQALHFSLRAISHHPHDAALHYHLSLIWKALRNSEKALIAVDNALRLRPNVGEWLMHRMLLLKTMRRDEEACDQAEVICNLPGFEHELDPLHTLFSAYTMRNDWVVAAVYAEKLRHALTRPQAHINPASVIMVIDDPALTHRLGAIHPPASSARPARTWDGDRKMILAYCTADIREHPVAHMLVEVLNHHDRERFELVLVKLAPTDASEIARKIAALFDREIDLTFLSDSDAARAIRDANIDILVDLMGITMGNRIELLALNPCAVQILWLGCPVSTGYRHYTGFIVDEIIAPPGYEAFCSEPLVRLPCCYHPISPGLSTNDSLLTRPDLDLPEDALIISLLQQPNRITPQFIEDLVRILADYPQVVFLMRIKADYRAKASAQFASWGLPAERIRFAPYLAKRSDYLKVLSLIDLAVDSHPHGGHSTAGELISIGTPLLTCRGNSIHSRVAASMLHEVGLADLVANSPAEQRLMLRHLIEQPELLALWKQRFSTAAAMPAEIRHARLTRALEDSYASMLGATPR